MTDSRIQSGASMQFSRFRAIVEAYGANPERWPRGERNAALAFREAEPEAAEPILAEARALDVLLNEATIRDLHPEWPSGRRYSDRPRR